MSPTPRTPAPSTSSILPCALRPGPSTLSKSAIAAVIAVINTMGHGGGTARADDQPAARPNDASAQPSTVLPEVEVNGESGYNTDSLSLQKFGNSLLTTPRTASVITPQLMQDQGVTSMIDALRNVSGVSIGAGEGSYQGDNLSIRGFAARSDIFLDGMSDFGNYDRDPFNTQQYEVIKGPSSVEFGRGSVGGAVNQESKTAQLQEFTAGSAEYGSDNTKRATLDFNEPIAGLANSAFRINMMGDGSQVTDRDDASFARWGIAPTIAFGINTPTRLTLSYFHQSEDNTPDYGIPWLFDRPAAVPQNTYYGFASDYLKTNVDIATVKFEHDFNDNLTLHEQFRFANYHRDFRISQADTSAIAPGTPFDQMQVGRDIIDGDSTDKLFDEDINLTSKFNTGPVQHTLVTGFEYVRQSVDPTRIEPTWANVPGTSLFFPDDQGPFPGTGSIGTSVTAYVQTISAYVIDTLKLGKQWTLLLGGRYDHVSSDYNESVTDTHFDVTNDLGSWRSALIYQPAKNGSIYVSGGTSVHPNIAQLSISSEPALPPSTASVAVGRDLEVEIGTKWSLFDNRLSINGALFWDQLKNPAPVDLDDPLIDTFGGKEIMMGFEFGMIGHITNRWQVLANYTVLDSKVTSASDPTFIGGPALNAPKNTFSLWTTYDLPWKLQVGFGSNAVSSRVASEQPDPATGSLMTAPGYIIFSAMVKYQMTQNIDVQLNVINLTDAYYYDGVHPGHVIPGEGRTFFISTNFKF